jgi:midasin (ATPase involved in ribosome maturation)
MFNSIDDVIERFSKQQYICNRRIATVVYLASQLRKPILVEGPAGVGKTELVTAAALDQELIRLQLRRADEAKALYEGNTRSSFYTQILKDKISEVARPGSLKEAVDRIAQEMTSFRLSCRDRCYGRSQPTARASC